MVALVSSLSHRAMLVSMMIGLNISRDRASKQLDGRIIKGDYPGHIFY